MRTHNKNGKRIKFQSQNKNYFTALIYALYNGRKFISSNTKYKGI